MKSYRCVPIEEIRSSKKKTNTYKKTGIKSTGQRYKPEPPYMSAVQAAKRLHISKDWCQRLMARGRIKAKKIEGNWAVHEDDLNTYISERV